MRYLRAYWRANVWLVYQIERPLRWLIAPLVLPLERAAATRRADRVSALAARVRAAGLDASGLEAAASAWRKIAMQHR